MCGESFLNNMWYLHLECRNVTVLCCLEFLKSVTVKKILESSDSNKSQAILYL